MVKRLILGKAMRSEQLGETLLPKRLALPVFASDALSSNAYATQEILLVLGMGGASLLGFAPLVAAGVVFVFAVVVLSYRQNVHAYPSGGGDYEVVTTNLGANAGLLVASALMIDYVMTVAVSIASAVDNLASAYAWIGDHRVNVALVLIVVIAAINLRGVKESGAAFAIPTYGFMAAIFLMLGTAMVRMFSGDVLRAESADWELVATGSFSGAALLFLLARAFASGTTALTGIEAISNGVPSFKKPKSKNAATTLAMLGAIAMAMFSGITWLAVSTGVQVAEEAELLHGIPAGALQKTVIAQIAETVFSTFPVGFYLVTGTTALILALAANTAFNGFPVLGSILARDGYLPRQLHTRGDRLAYSNGIISLAVVAASLIIVYKASVTALIQLYILGVFVSFTLSQFGMIRHWNRHLVGEKDAAARRKMVFSRAVNAVGFVITGSVLVIVLLTKFTHGAYIICIAMPLLWLLMRSIRRHYNRVAAELSVSSDQRSTLPPRTHAIVTVSKLHKATLRAVNFARASRHTTLEAVTVNVDPDVTERLLQEWVEHEIPVPLRVLDSPYREITRPLLKYVEELRTSSNDLIVVYIPEYVVGHWWESLLHNQSALRLKTQLRFLKRVIVASVPYQMADTGTASDEFAS